MLDLAHLNISSDFPQCPTNKCLLEVSKWSRKACFPSPPLVPCNWDPAGELEVVGHHQLILILPEFVHPLPPSCPIQQSLPLGCIIFSEI